MNSLILVLPNQDYVLLLLLPNTVGQGINSRDTTVVNDQAIIALHSITYINSMFVSCQENLATLCHMYITCMQLSTV